MICSRLGGKNEFATQKQIMMPKYRDKGNTFFFGRPSRCILRNDSNSKHVRPNLFLRSVGGSMKAARESIGNPIL